MPMLDRLNKTHLPFHIERPWTSMKYWASFFWLMNHFILWKKMSVCHYITGVMTVPVNEIEGNGEGHWYSYMLLKMQSLLWKCPENVLKPYAIFLSNNVRAHRGQGHEHLWYLGQSVYSLCVAFCFISSYNNYVEKYLVVIPCKRHHRVLYRRSQ